MGIVGTSISTVSLNLVASFLYSALTKSDYKSIVNRAIEETCRHFRFQGIEVKESDLKWVLGIDRSEQTKDDLLPVKDYSELDLLVARFASLTPFYLPDEKRKIEVAVGIIEHLYNKLEHLILEDEKLGRRLLKEEIVKEVESVNKQVEYVQIDLGRVRSKLDAIDNIIEGLPGETARIIQEYDQTTQDYSHRLALEEYQRALLTYCNQFAYLSLYKLFGTEKEMDQIYVPLRTIKYKDEDEDKKRKEDRRRKDEDEKRIFKKEYVEEILKDRSTETTLTKVLDVATEKNEHVFIFGDPGAGKSTMLREIARYAYDSPERVGLNRSYLPILIRLRALAGAKGSSIQDRLENALTEASELILRETLPERFFSEWPVRFKSKWLVLLDGLDEVASDRQTALIRWLTNMLDTVKLDKHLAIITSRPIGGVYNQFKGRANIYELQPFTTAQQNKFAQNWFGQQATYFSAELEKVHATDLRGTPLLLTISAMVYSSDGHLPHRRSALYERFIDIWLTEAMEQGLASELGERISMVVRRCLDYIAFSMTNRPDETSLEDLKRIAARYFHETLWLTDDEAEVNGAKFVSVIGRRSGVLIRRGNSFEWIHPTFREYLTARILQRQLRKTRRDFATILHDRPLDPQWNEVIVLLSEIFDETRDLVNWLLSEYADEGASAVLLATRCWLASQAVEDLEIREAIIDALLGVLKDTDRITISGILGTLSEIGIPAIEPLVMLLKNARHDQILQEEITKYLIQIGIPAIEPVIALLRDTDYDIRVNITYFLHDVGIPVVEPFVTLLKDPDKSIRYRAIETLALMKSWGLVWATEPFILLLKDPEESVRAQAADALGRLGDGRAVGPLISALQDNSEFVRSIAERSLESLHWDYDQLW